MTTREYLARMRNPRDWRDAAVLALFGALAIALLYAVAGQP